MKFFARARFTALALIGAAGCIYYLGRSFYAVTSVRLFHNIAPEIVFYSEDPSHTRLNLLKKSEKLESLTAGASTDLEKAYILRSWAAKMRWEKNYPAPYPPWDALTILDWIRSGKTGGHCGQRGIVFGQACQSLGIPVRYADLSSKDGGGGHFTVEVYIKELRKWVVMDPTFDFSFKEKGVFLNAREIHSRLVSGSAGGVILDKPREQPSAGDLLKLFYYYRYYLRNDFISRPAAISFIDHGKGGSEMIFNEERLHWLDAFTRDKASRSSRSSDSPASFDWAYADPGLIFQRGPFRTFRMASRDKSGKKRAISVRQDLSYGADGNGEKPAQKFIAELPFSLRLAGGRRITVTVTEPGGKSGAIITLDPLWQVFWPLKNRTARARLYYK